MATDAAGHDLERVFRAEHGRVVAALTRYLGSIDLAEDAASEAYVAALETWPRDGIPPNPGAWLTTTARRRAIDRIRRETNRPGKEGQAHVLLESQAADHPGPDSAIVDDRLRMIFTCCHPALDPAAQVALQRGLSAGAVDLGQRAPRVDGRGNSLGPLGLSLDARRAGGSRLARIARVDAVAPRGAGPG